MRPIDLYMALIRERLESILLQKDYFGKMIVTVNIKSGGISDIRICNEESIRI